MLDEITYADTAALDVDTVPTFSRLLREFGTYIARQKRILVELTQLEQGVRFNREAVSIALACAGTDTTYPPADPKVLGTAINHACEGRLDHAVVVAKALVEQEIAVAYAAMSGAKSLNMLGDSFPATWSNLPAHLLAREVNRTTHTVFRGRVPGWKE